MATQNPKTINLDISGLNNGIRSVFKNTSGFGDITVLSAQVLCTAAGTGQLYLVNSGTDGGDTSGGTIASPAGTTYTAGTPSSMTVASVVLSEGNYLGVKENNVGTLPGTSCISVTYVYGI
jgi:hypothetical protein